MPFETFRTTTGEVVSVNVANIMGVSEPGPDRALKIYVRGRPFPYFVAISEDDKVGPFRRLLKDQP
ncbi:hypothetical protein CN135_25150 [Sinorhizobium meliloti]|uniref:hypothetical protein n=1 Tax=Rhizobium meliloti TaxID=382 RepID=UPI000FDBF786|nr:hypothetical protein [Sinorhizobium meliloti]RVL75348.1 hypothetical protein CN135_25150 [Sinorhizobium meliloti]